MKGGGQIDCLPGKATLEKPSFSRINGFPEKIYNTKYKYEIERQMQAFLTTFGNKNKIKITINEMKTINGNNK